MDLLNNLININRHVFNFIRKKNSYDMNYNTHYNNTIENTIDFDKISNIYIDKISKLSVELEDVYYHNLMFPKLQNIWNIEKNIYIACITCIIHVINQISGCNITSVK